MPFSAAVTAFAASFVRIERLVTEDVVDVQAFGREPLALRQIASAANELLVGLRIDDQDLLAGVERLERRGDRLGLAIGTERVEDDELLLAGAERESSAERRLLHLTRQLVLVAARLGTEHRRTTDPVRRLTAALACLAGTLLLPNLLRRTANLTEALGRGITTAALRELPLHGFPEEVLVVVRTEDGVVEVERPTRCRSMFLTSIFIFRYRRLRVLRS